ncbi:MAG: glycosyltransferase family 4 protein [Planctomycetia bacterium]|nr:glycosyltransferase family 4 protein [Planctomycetia bacterium]
MSPIRPVFLARRFWPRMDGAARTVADLAAELAARGAEPTVLTVLEHPAWPASIRCRGVSVKRFAKPLGRLGEFRYERELARWLRENADRYDLLYVSGLKHDAYAAVSAVGGRVPVVLRAEKAGRHGDCLWQLDARCGRRIKRCCLKASALVGPSRQTHAELVAAGYPRPRIHHIPHGVSPRPKRNHRTKRLARAALAESRSALDLPNWAPLAIYTGRLHRAKDLAQLVAAWRPIADRWPNAQLWLAGDGPDRAALLEQIEARHLTGRVALVGTFDCVDVLLDAADLFVHPSPDEDMSVSILEAMAAGLPIVACDIPGNRDLVSDGCEGLLTPPGDAAALSAAIGRLLDQPELAVQLGAAAQDRAGRDFPLAKSVDAHITLFEELLAGRDRGFYGREKGTAGEAAAEERR